ncbi:PKD domain-containing protein [Methanoregula sp.]|uniref:PKD domain-containing protein n=1 Tax=Methanoregula sp. TaxID=2052170 RepID=UPI00236D6E4E|nr:PKD domain-containing protein [Methanoregula sp.]MDD1686473.1 PKD domain-containing protein [Methanoregula sp.]
MPRQSLPHARESGASELIGAILLISIVIAGIAIIGVMLTSAGTPQRVPALDAVISNIDRTVYIYHNGGDALSSSDAIILVNDQQRSFSKNRDFNWTTWGVGDTLAYTVPGTDPISNVKIIYARGGAASSVLSEAQFGPEGISTPVPVVHVPDASFNATPRSVYITFPVNFTDTSLNTPTSWLWDFGDETTSTEQNPSHTYTLVGVYTVTLTATNSAGSDSETQSQYITVTAGNGPVANFSGTPLSGYAPQTVAFTDLSTNSPTTWSWNFGDGGTSVLQNPTHQYTVAGTYTVSLTVTNTSSGVTNTRTKADYILVKTFAQYVSDENVFVYGSKLYFQGKRVTGPGSTVIITGTSITTGDFNGGAFIDVSNIYVDGDVNLNTGSASWGSSSSPGIIFVNGDMTVLSGGRDLYGDVYVADNFDIKDAKIHGTVYVDGDVTLGWTPTLDANSYIYYTGTLNHPSSYNQAILDKCVKQATVPTRTMPDLTIPAAKTPAWYATNGYTSSSSGPLVSNMKIIADTGYSSSSWGSAASNVVIVARTGDITLAQGGGWGDLTGVLFAPGGRVSFTGGDFEGLVIAKDGFYVYNGGTTVTFKNLADYFSSSADYPF